MKTIFRIILFLLMALAPPLASQAQTTETYTFTTNRLVPDGNPAGLSDVRTVNSAIAKITSLTVHLKTTGEFNGDLYGYLVHSNGFTVLLNRAGKAASNFYGYADSGFDVTFQDGAAAGDVHLYQTNTVPAAGAPLTGIWQPDGRNVDPAAVLDTSPRTTGLTNFNGLNASGGWTLYLADLESGGTNELTQWTLTIAGSAAPTLAWTAPTNIVYGTTLGAQLNATAIYNATNVSGTFTYTNAAGTALAAGSVLSVGTNQTLFVTFTPTDSASFIPVTTSVTITVTAVPVTVASGLTAANKVYDGTTVAAIASNNVSLSGILSGDLANVSLSTNGSSAAFISQNVGNGVTVNLSGLTLKGSAATNYALTQPALAANITAKPLTVTGLSVPASKVYDGTTSATVSGTATLLAAEAATFGTGGDGKPYSGDTVTLGGTASGSYNSLTVAVASLVTMNGLSTANGNYSITPPTQAATITKKPLTVSGITTASTTYDGTTTAKLSGTAAFLAAETTGSGTAIDGKPYTLDSVTASGTAAGTLAAKDVGNEAVTISGITIAGTGNGNYSVPQPTGLTQNVTTKALTMSGLSVPSSRIYNGNTAATVSGTPVLPSPESAGAGTTSDGAPYTGDAVSITGTATGTYNSSNVLAASSVSFGGLTLAGNQASDYSLTAQAAAATITPSRTTGAVVSSTNPALPGATVMFTMTISPIAPGAGTPTGAVNFRINGTIATGGTLTGGIGTFASNSLPHGSNTVIAEYAGDGNFAGITNTLAPAEVINTPPLAGNLTIYRYATAGTRVSVADILTNCSDADSDTLTLTVNSTSTNGDAVTVSNGWVYYTPNSGFTNADAFTYTASDGFGGSAQGTVTVAIEVDNSPAQNLTITALGDGSYLISGNGIPGYSYDLQFTSTLSPPNWQSIPTANISAGTNGGFQFTNTPSGGGMGFYRTVYP